MKNRTLEMIWQEAVRPADPAATASFKGLIDALLPVKSVLLSADHGVDSVAVIPDEVELMPALSLGDVLVEELQIDVPYGSLAILCEQSFLDGCVDSASVSRAVGMAVGQTLLTVLRQGAFPLERENEALFVLASAYDQVARSPEFEQLGLIYITFSAGLASVVGMYWSGARDCAATSHPFKQPGCLGQVATRRYLTLLDPGFRAPEYAQIPATLLSFPQGCFRFDDWVQTLTKAVTGALKPRLKSIIPN